MIKFSRAALLGVLLICMFGSCAPPKTNLWVMSFNVRLDTPEDSLNSWIYRKDVAAKAIILNDADIVGTQEVRYNQLTDLAASLPDYSHRGVGREDGVHEGEHCAVFFKTEKFEALEDGNFWLSEYPDSAGTKGWDAACERVATWVILREKLSGREFFFINTHLDHVGQKARIEGVKLMIDRASALALGRPVILTGDFNVEPESDVIRFVSQDSRLSLRDSRFAAEEVLSDVAGTFHDFGRVPLELYDYIDYIFVTPDVRVLNYKVTEQKIDGTFVSDHMPIVAEIEL